MIFLVVSCKVSIAVWMSVSGLLALAVLKQCCAFIFQGLGTPKPHRWRHYIALKCWEAQTLHHILEAHNPQHC
jgi:hypothetical protein